MLFWNSKPWILSKTLSRPASHLTHSCPPPSPHTQRLLGKKCACCFKDPRPSAMWLQLLITESGGTWSELQGKGLRRYQKSPGTWSYWVRKALSILCSVWEPVALSSVEWSRMALTPGGTVFSLPRSQGSLHSCLGDGHFRFAPWGYISPFPP